MKASVVARFSGPTYPQRSVAYKVRNARYTDGETLSDVRRMKTLNRGIWTYKIKPLPSTKVDAEESEAVAVAVAVGQ